MSQQQFIENMTHMDDLLDHSKECGQCEHQKIMAQVAREMQVVNNFCIHEWSEEVKRRWQESEYFKLYQAEKMAGRDPKQAFQDRGWEM